LGQVLHYSISVISGAYVVTFSTSINYIRWSFCLAFSRPFVQSTAEGRVLPVPSIAEGPVPLPSALRHLTSVRDMAPTTDPECLNARPDPIPDELIPNIAYAWNPTDSFCPEG